MIHPAPKPPKREKKARKPILRTSALKRIGKPKARNAKRRASEFARCYGSKERVQWVKSLPCCACVTYWPIQPAAGWVSENAHTVTGGMSRKADADTIVPLCANHHRRYDRHLAPFNSAEIREELRHFAAHVSAAWHHEGVRRGVSSLASDGE